ncbi:sensor histidine kinase [Nocardioides aestuarii]|uniref:histidine kinase n=1 Tax=Nocardioides aestuarii TaxID=252231 RepID=A0ABW4TMN1_9ACTN
MTRERWAPLVLPVLSVAAFAATVVLDLREPLPGGPPTVTPEPGWIYALNGVVLAVLAAIVLRNRPGHGFGWALAGFGLFWALDGLAQAYVRVGLSPDEAWPGMTFALWFLLRAGSLLPVVTAVLLLLFPTGRFLPGRWGVASRAGLGAMLLVCLALVVSPTLPGGAPPVPSGVDLTPTSIPVPAAVTDVVGPLLRPLGVIAFLVAPATVVVRYRASRGADRQQLRWLLWSVLVMLLAVAVTSLVDVPFLGVVMTFLVMVMPAGAMTIAIVRPDLVAIDVLFSRTLLYASLWTLVVVIDLAALAGITAVVGDALDQQQVVLLVLLLTAVVYAPLRDRLRTGVRRLVLGDRDDPYDVVAGLASTLERTDSAGEQLAAVARTVATAFGVRYVRVEVDRAGSEHVVATHGTAPAETRTLPVTYRDQEVGRIVLPARGLRSRLSGRDERLLGDLVRQAAIAARTSRLAEELQDSRERLVVAREEERRRIRRDLHDGLGPALSGVVFRLESARLLVPRDPTAAADQIGVTTGEVQEVVADVRRLVHDLRPPALDDRGLAGALAQLAEGLSTDALAVTVTTGELDDLSAAVEVAAYRIAAEALTNVARHAAATHASVTLTRDADALLVEVVDDGRGIDPDAQAGVGMLSLRERAAELGGTTEVTCPPAGGTVVRARLPLGAMP